MAEVINHIYQLKRGKADVLEARNPSLRYGEPIVAFFPNGKIKLKVGDGVNNYNDLPFVGEEEQVVFSFTSYFDFPNIGKEGIIYHAQDTEQLYQWKVDIQLYKPLIAEVIYDCITGGDINTL